jgi:hypothetical protein
MTIQESLRLARPLDEGDEFNVCVAATSRSRIHSLAAARSSALRQK